MTREEAWELSEVFGTEIIDKIYDDFESRTCENCKHFIDSECMVIGDWDCYYDSPAQWTPPKDFGCNKFVRKQQ